MLENIFGQKTPEAPKPVDPAIEELKAKAEEIGAVADAKAAAQIGELKATSDEIAADAMEKAKAIKEAESAVEAIEARREHPDQEQKAA